MKIAEAIKHLQSMDQEEEIIIAWWDQESIGVSNEQWERVIAREGKIDWSYDHEALAEIAEMD